MGRPPAANRRPLTPPPADQPVGGRVGRIEGTDNAPELLAAPHLLRGPAPDIPPRQRDDHHVHHRDRGEHILIRFAFHARSFWCCNSSCQWPPRPWPCGPG